MFAPAELGWRLSALLHHPMGSLAARVYLSPLAATGSAPGALSECSGPSRERSRLGAPSRQLFGEPHLPASRSQELSVLWLDRQSLPRTPVVGRYPRCRSSRVRRAEWDRTSPPGRTRLADSQE